MVRLFHIKIREHFQKAVHQELDYLCFYGCKCKKTYGGRKIMTIIDKQRGIVNCKLSLFNFWPLLIFMSRNGNNILRKYFPVDWNIPWNHKFSDCMLTVTGQIESSVSCMYPWGIFWSKACDKKIRRSIKELNLINVLPCSNATFHDCLEPTSQRRF